MSDGRRSGPGEYDPDRTTLGERRAAKAADLAVLRPEETKLLLGVATVGVRTLERWEKRRRKYGIVGCADHRWLRASGGHPSVSEEVREAIFAVRAETQQHRSRVSARTREAMIRRYVRETFEKEDGEEGGKGGKPQGKKIGSPAFTHCCGCGRSGSGRAVPGRSTSARPNCPPGTGMCW